MPKYTKTKKAKKSMPTVVKPKVRKGGVSPYGLKGKKKK